jgi:very-short-patch-repair endonuclease
MDLSLKVPFNYILLLLLNRCKMTSHLEREFENLWESLYPDIDLFTEEKLIPKRNFRFDYVHKESKVAIEINGQIWVKGGHSSGKGLLRDYEKLNLVQSLGYTVFQLSGDMINEYWLNIIVKTIKKKTRDVDP